MSYWKTIAALISDTTARLVRADASTHALEIIEYEHHEMHAGSHYFIKDYVDLTGAGTVAYFMFITPNTTTWAHAKAHMTCEDEFVIEIFENPTITANGTLLTAINNNRNSANVATLLPYAGPTVTADGTRIWRAIVGAGKEIGVDLFAYEIIAKQNTTYLWKVTKGNAGTHYIDFDFFWYEHADKL